MYLFSFFTFNPTFCALGGERRAAGALRRGDEVQHGFEAGRAAHSGEAGELRTVPQSQPEDHHVRHAFIQNSRFTWKPLDEGFYTNKHKINH